MKRRTLHTTSDLNKKSIFSQEPGLHWTIGIGCTDNTSINPWPPDYTPKITEHEFVVELSNQDTQKYHFLLSHANIFILQF